MGRERNVGGYDTHFVEIEHISFDLMAFILSSRQTNDEGRGTVKVWTMGL